MEIPEGDLCIFVGPNNSSKSATGSRQGELLVKTMNHMIKLLFQFYSPSLAALQGRLDQQKQISKWEFNYSGNYGIRAVLQDYLDKVDGLNLHYGLLITTSLEAPSAEEGLEISKAVAESLLNSVTLSSMAFCGPAKLIGNVDLGHMKIRSLGYPFGLHKSPEGSLAIVKQEEFQEIFNKYEQATSKDR